ncbi:MAG: FeoB-associated Cys-rich membrane protein [Clostridiales bacterium]|nr:FeoB-associated Cys-rich membrane protein [Clostridiales bacterium]
MTDIIVIVIVLAIIGAAAGYVIRAKKRGVKCIGCPNGSKCASKGNCSCCAKKE